MHRHLYTSPDELDDRHLRRYAHEIGLDLQRYDEEMAASKYSDQIVKDYYNSIIFGITGTPTTFINGELYAMGGLELLTTVKDMVKRT